MRPCHRGHSVWHDGPMWLGSGKWASMRSYRLLGGMPTQPMIQSIGMQQGQENSDGKILRTSFYFHGWYQHGQNYGHTIIRALRLPVCGWFQVPGALSKGRSLILPEVSERLVRVK